MSSPPRVGGERPGTRLGALVGAQVGARPAPPRSAPGAAMLAALLAAAAPSEGVAQTWNLDSYAGQASYQTLPASTESRTGVLGLRFNHDRRFLSAAVSIPFSAETTTWGVVRLGDRLALRRGGLVAGADVSLLVHGHRDPLSEARGRGVLAEILPMVSHPLGQAVLELRSGPRWYGATHGEADWTRSFWTTEGTATLEPSGALRLEGSARHERGEEGEAYSRAGISAAAALGPVVAQASLGAWVDGVDDADPEWALGVSVPVLERAWVFATARRESFDPHFLNPPRTSWGVGVTLRLGGSAARSPASGGEVREGGRVVVRLPLRDATTQPSIAGDFTGWLPVAMERHGTEWRYEVDLPPGAYRFAFRDRSGRWFVPESVPHRTDDGMGGHAAVLLVR